MTKTYNAIVAVQILYQSAGCSTKTRASIRKIYGFVLIFDDRNYVFSKGKTWTNPCFQWSYFYEERIAFMVVILRIYQMQKVGEFCSC